MKPWQTTVRVLALGASVFMFGYYLGTEDPLHFAVAWSLVALSDGVSWAFSDEEVVSRSSATTCVISLLVAIIGFAHIGATP